MISAVHIHPYQRSPCTQSGAFLSMRLPGMIKEQRLHLVVVQRPTQLQEQLQLFQLLHLCAVAIHLPAGIQPQMEQEVR